MRGLKMRVPVSGLRVKLIPTTDELAESRDFGRRLASALVGTAAGAVQGAVTARSATADAAARVIDFAELGP